MERGRALGHQLVVIASAKRGMGRGAVAPFPMLVGALVAALILTVKVEETRLEAQRRRTAAAILEEANRSAERDTTRDVALNARVAKVLGDSLHLVEKQVVQTVQSRDALDAALGRERAARYVATAAVDSLERLVRATDADVRDIRSAHFDVRQAPYTIAADVVLPPLPDSAKLRVSVAVDPIPIEARITCADVGSGAREASVSVETPAWVRVKLGTVAQAPEVCARSPTPSVARRLSWIVTPRLVLGVGRAWSVDRRGRWGIFVGAAIAIL